MCSERCRRTVDDEGQAADDGVVRGHEDQVAQGAVSPLEDVLGAVARRLRVVQPAARSSAQERAEARTTNGGEGGQGDVQSLEERLRGEEPYRVLRPRRAAAPISSPYACLRCMDRGHLEMDSLSIVAERGLPAEEVRWCSCGRETAARAWFVEYGREMNGRRLKRLFATAGIPERFGELTLDSLPGAALEGKRRAVAAARMFLQEGEVTPSRLGEYDPAAALRPNERVAAPERPRRGLVLTGPAGVGKTGILTPVLAGMVARGEVGLWIEWYRFCGAVQSGYGDGSAAARKEEASRVELVLLDDVGDVERAGEETDDKRRILWEVVNERHGADRMTLLTTNLDEGRFREQFGVRTAERVWEMSFVVPVGGVNLRRR